MDNYKFEISHFYFHPVFLELSSICAARSRVFKLGVALICRAMLNTCLGPRHIKDFWSDSVVLELHIISHSSRCIGNVSVQNMSLAEK
jgi:hypothetical protein